MKNYRRWDSEEVKDIFYYFSVKETYIDRNIYNVFVFVHVFSFELL